jgi:hypothetical protein
VGPDLKSHAILTSMLDREEAVTFMLRLIYPRGRGPSTRWIGDWIELIASFDSMVMKTVPTSIGIQHRPPVCSQSLY